MKQTKLIGPAFSHLCGRIGRHIITTKGTPT
jgi:hypothetical protein